MGSKNAMGMVIEDMGRAAREGRSRRMREKFRKMENPDHGADQTVDPVTAEPALSAEDLKTLEDLSVQR